MFESASLKIERANRHIADLWQMRHEFARNNPHKISTKSEGEGDRTLVQFLFEKPLPEAVVPTLGDAARNLLAGLDHLMWELVDTEGGMIEPDCGFPLVRTKGEFEDAVDAIKTPRPDTKAFLKGFETYLYGRGHRLFGLEVLAGIDQHRTIPILASAGTVDKLTVRCRNGNQREIENYSGRVGPDGYVDFFTVEPAARIEIDAKWKVVPEIFFENIEVFAFEPLCSTLAGLAGDVAAIRDAFVDLVDTRGKPKPIAQEAGKVVEWRAPGEAQTGSD